MMSSGDILNEFVEYLPPAWQFPEVTTARITINESEFTTNDFREGTWKQSAHCGWARSWEQ